MTTGDGPSDQGSINWEQLDAELLPSEEQAEALHWQGIEQTAGDIREAVSKVLPEGITFRPIVRTHPEIASDGNPMVVTREEMQAIKAERPDIAEAVDRIVAWNTLAERQQLELDIEDATDTDDQEGLQRLEKEKLKLEEHSYYLEGFTIQSVLHPFSRSYVAEHVQSFPGAAGSLDEQVRCLMYLNKDIPRLSAALQGQSPRAIAYWLEQTEDPVERRQLTNLLHWSEGKAAELAKARRIISDVISGQAAIEYDFSEPKPQVEEAVVSQGAIESTPHYETLKNLPGLDPALYLGQGRLRELPRSGWLVESRFDLDQKGTIRIYRFEKGGLRATGIYSRTETDSIGAHFEIKCGIASDYEVNYLPKDQDANDEGTLSCDNQVVELSKDMVLRSPRLPMRTWNGSGSALRNFHYRDIDRQLSTGLRYPKWPTKVELNRVTDSIETLKKIVSGLGESMGLKDEELAELIDVFVRNDVLGDQLLRQTQEEKETKEAYLNRDTVLWESDDGSRREVEDIKGNRFIEEPDGSRWISYSASSHLSYMGPDDYVGYYNE